MIDVTYILAAGKAQRWEQAVPKQFVKVGGERIINRAARLFPGSVVVTCRKDIAAGVDCGVQMIEPTSSICETVLECDWREDRVAFLCGDVFWTASAAHKVREESSGLMFFGNKQEIFGFTVERRYYTLMQYYLEVAAEEKGKLWNAYRHLISVSEHRIDGYFTRITDITTDFDNYEQYLKFLKCLK